MVAGPLYARSGGREVGMVEGEKGDGSELDRE